MGGTKINMYHSDGKTYFWQRLQEKLQCGGILVVCLEKKGMYSYLHILNSQLFDFVDKCAFPAKEIMLQQDGDPKHMAKIVQEGLQAQTFKTL